MNFIHKIKDRLKLNIGVVVLAVALISLFLPSTSLWIQLSWINPLLMVIMFGMGLTINPSDFVLVFTRPKEIILGSLSQFIIMPSVAFALSYIFKLDQALTVGVMLVGTCPGGTASNVITYLAKGDVALSVGMTSVNTLLAPLLTPLITYFFLSTTVSVDTYAMFISILKVVLFPLGIGFLFNKFFWNCTKKIIELLPLLSTVAICLIIASVVAHNADKIYSMGFTILLVVILHNLFGFYFGFLVGKIAELPQNKIKTLSIEIGMQNSGLATSLAGTSFPDLSMATVPGAIFSVWHNISGAILASYFKKWKN